MIYITKTIDNEIVTDNITNFIPDNLDVYLDDILIGTYENYSETTLLLKFTLPAEATENLSSKEHILKIYNHSALIKKELVIVRQNGSSEFISINNTNTVKFYE
jgi:hypothetical protein